MVPFFGTDPLQKQVYTSGPYNETVGDPMKAERHYVKTGRVNSRVLTQVSVPTRDSITCTKDKYFSLLVAYVFVFDLFAVWQTGVHGLDLGFVLLRLGGIRVPGYGSRSKLRGVSFDWTFQRKEISQETSKGPFKISTKL